MSPPSATILVVGDEPTVLDTVRDGLTAHGYQVLKASGGEEALQVAQTHPGAIALALVDVVMPTMGGPEVAQRLHVVRPDLKIGRTLKYCSCPASRSTSWSCAGSAPATRCSSNHSVSRDSRGRSTRSSTTARRSLVPRKRHGSLQSTRLDHLTTPRCRRKVLCSGGRCVGAR